MSYESLNNDVLRQVAEHFGVEVKKTDNKAKMIAALVEDGVDWEMYKEAFPDVEDLPDAEPENVATPVVEKEPVEVIRSAPTVLVKMERMNPRFEIRGYKFSKDHPFVPVTEEDANYIISNLDGFRIAMPKEAEDFYS